MLKAVQTETEADRAVNMMAALHTENNLYRYSSVPLQQ